MSSSWCCPNILHFFRRARKNGETNDDSTAQASSEPKETQSERVNYPDNYIRSREDAENAIEIEAEQVVLED